jgi:hypothetical protein
MDSVGVGVAPTVEAGGAWVSTNGAEAQPASATIVSNAGTSQQRADTGKWDGICIRSILVVLGDQSDLTPSAPTTLHLLLAYAPSTV